MKWLIRLFVNGLAVFISAYILPGISVDTFVTALVVSVVLGIANTLLRPILIFLTLPITLLTLGLFTLVINALLVLLVAQLVPGFYVANFIWALLFSMVLSLVSWFLNSLAA